MSKRVSNAQKEQVYFLHQNLDKLSASDQRFASSLVTWGRDKPFSERQVPHVERLIEFIRNPPPPPAPLPERQLYRVSKIHVGLLVDMFEHSGRDTVRAVILDDVSVRVKMRTDFIAVYGGEYPDGYAIGKLNLDTAQFVPGHSLIACEQAEATVDMLAELAENPMETLKHYGRITGSCSVCGRTLTDPESIAQGIGPICAGGF